MGIKIEAKVFTECLLESKSKWVYWTYISCILQNGMKDTYYVLGYELSALLCI